MGEHAESGNTVSWPQRIRPIFQNEPFGKEIVKEKIEL